MGMYCFLGGQKIFVFLSSLDFIFRLKGTLLGGGGGEGKTLQTGGGGHRGWEALAPPVYMLKKVLFQAVRNGISHIKLVMM